VFCHPFALIGALGALLASFGAALAAHWDLAFSLLIASFVLVLGGALIAALQRAGCARRIKGDIGWICASPQPPHVIAHSFGTYIIGQVLTHQDVSFDRVALVGSVLPRDFAWDGLLEDGRPAFGEVRNETGARDWVVWLAGRARWLAWTLAMLVAEGFRSARLCTTDGPWSSCETCVGPSPYGLVHNVPRNSTQRRVSRPAHAQRLWLPFLWASAGRVRRLCVHVLGRCGLPSGRPDVAV
jgi:hypothetical protein